jgi:hypothetical protein
MSGNRLSGNGRPHILWVIRDQIGDSKPRVMGTRPPAYVQSEYPTATHQRMMPMTETAACRLIFRPRSGKPRRSARRYWRCTLIAATYIAVAPD